MSSAASDPSRPKSSSAAAAPSDTREPLDHHQHRRKQYSLDLRGQGRSRRAPSSPSPRDVGRTGSKGGFVVGEGVVEQEQYRHHRRESIGGGGGGRGGVDLASTRPRPSRIESVDSGFRQFSSRSERGSKDGTLALDGQRGGGLNAAAGGSSAGARSGARKEPFRKTNSAGDTLARFLSSVSVGSNVSDGLDNKSGISGERKTVSPRGGSVGGPAPFLAGLPARKKKSFMEKVGDMLEAAAETAIPTTPAHGAIKRPRKPPTWEHWDAATLDEFMAEEARAMVDSRRLEDVKRAGGDKEKLIELAKSWRVPILSQVDFIRQKAALQHPDVGTVGNDGRCVPPSTAGATASLDRKFRSVSPPPIPASLNDPILSRLCPRRDASRGGDELSLVKADASVSGEERDSKAGDDENDETDEVEAGDDELTGTTVGGDWICRAAVLGCLDGATGKKGGVGGGVHGPTDKCLVSAAEGYYLVEVETLMGGGGGGGTWGCYKRYSDFRALWRGLSRLHSVLVERVEQEENFDLFLRAASALLGLGGGLFTGARRALERRRLSKLNDMLRAMLELNPRPQELVRFLEPHAAAGDPPVASSTVIDAYKSRGKLDLQQQRGRSLKGWLLEGPEATNPLSTTPALRLFLVIVAALEACAAAVAGGVIRSVEATAIFAFVEVVACAACTVVVRWAPDFLRRRRQQWRRQPVSVDGVDGSGLRLNRAGEGSLSTRNEQKENLKKAEEEKSSRNDVLGGGAVAAPTAAADSGWVRVVMGAEIFATVMVLIVYVVNVATPRGSVKRGAGAGDFCAPARGGANLLAVVLRSAIGVAWNGAKEAVVAVILAVVLPPVIAAIATRRSILRPTNGNGGDVTPATTLLEEAVLTTVAIGGGAASLLCCVLAASLPVLAYFLAKLHDFIISPLSRHLPGAAPRSKESPSSPTMTRHVDAVRGPRAIKSSRGETSEKEGKAVSPVSSTWKAKEASRERGRARGKRDDPSDSRGATVWRRVRTRVDRVRVSIARAVMPRSEGEGGLHPSSSSSKKKLQSPRRDGDKDETAYPSEEPELPSLASHEPSWSHTAASGVRCLPSSTEESVDPWEVERSETNPAWRFQGPLGRKGLEWASHSLGAVDRAAAAMYAPRRQCARGGGVRTCGNDVLVEIADVSTRVTRGGLEASTAMFGSLADVVLVWVLVGLLWAVLGRECRLARRKRWRRLALALAGKLVLVGCLFGAYLMWTAALSPPRLSRLSGGGPFLLLCAVEAWRCVALLALILAAVQAGSVDSDAPSEGDAVRWNHSASRSGGAYDPTTPRGEHLSRPRVLPAATLDTFGRRSTRAVTRIGSARGWGPTVPSGEGASGWLGGSLHGTAGSDAKRGRRVFAERSSSLHGVHGGGGRDVSGGWKRGDDGDDGIGSDGVHDRE